MIRMRFPWLSGMISMVVLAHLCWGKNYTHTICPVAMTFFWMVLFRFLFGFVLTQAFIMRIHLRGRASWSVCLAFREHRKITMPQRTMKNNKHNLGSTRSLSTDPKNPLSSLLHKNDIIPDHFWGTNNDDQTHAFCPWSSILLRRKPNMAQNLDLIILFVICGR